LKLIWYLIIGFNFWQDVLTINLLSLRVICNIRIKIKFCLFLSKNSPIELKLISMIKANAFWISLSKNRPTLVLKNWNFKTQLTLMHSVAPFMFQNCTKMSHKQCTLCYAYHVGNDNHGKNRSDSHTYSRILTKFPNFQHQHHWW
jgi:hypothetical protein